MSMIALNKVKILLFIACLLPLLRTALWLALGHKVNPVEFLIRDIGAGGLILLCVTLAMTPLRQITGLSVFLQCRRMLGLFSYFYISLHLLSYVVLDKELDFADILHDVIKRPFIAVGMFAFLLLTPLAVTSTQAMQRRLKRNWKKLHSLVYVIAVLAIVHFYLEVKRDITEPLLYATVVAVLLGWRVLAYWRKKRAAMLRQSS